MSASDPDTLRFRTLRTIARWALGGALIFAGASHFGPSRQEFQAQVPGWFPIEADLVVVLSGIAEIALGASLIALPRWRATVGLISAAFFVAIFPGNVAQYVEGVDAFGLDTDRARFIRLFFQPAFVLWALWSTGASDAVATWWRNRGAGN